MSRNPKEHFQRTSELAQKLTKSDIYDWLVTKGYFPEAYVLPPCFEVTDRRNFEQMYFPVEKKNNGKTKFQPAIHEVQQIHFPKTDLTDRTLGASRFGQSITSSNAIARVLAPFKESTRQIGMLPFDLLVGVTSAWS